MDKELKQGLIKQYDHVTLYDYGYYLVYPENALEQPVIRALRDWVMHFAS